MDSFGGVIITVCHDRYFLDRVVDKLFVFKGQGTIEIHHGSYSDLKEDRGPMSSLTGVTALKENRKGERLSEADLPKKITKEEEVPKKKGLNKAQEAEYQAILEELDQVEHLIKGLDLMLAQAGTDLDKIQELMEEKGAAQKRSEELTDRWLELEEML